MRLLGRADECAALDGLIADIRRGESRSLLLRGEAGIGKTALLEYLVESASDLVVVRAMGVESEMELAFASLHQLSAPMLDRLPALPEPQRHALETVFGRSRSAPTDRFLVGLAVLSLFSLAAEERPLLCVVDDAQWLDQASALTLGFVARRLLAEPVGIVFAARQREPELQQLPEMEVQGVPDRDARTLLRSAVRFPLDERIRDRVIAETRGNPLALLELPRGLTATQLAGGFGVLGAQALAGRIEESFLRQLRTVSADARRLALLAAAEPLGDPLLLRRAAAEFGIRPEVADELRAHGLLAIDGQVTFRHPLARSAVYGSAAVHERRTVHLALAKATDQVIDPDRRAWHLAAAAAGPDEDVALELERSAVRAQTRGGLAAAAAFLQRAVALTKDLNRRADRALAAAEASLQAGVFDEARELLATAEAGPCDERQQARIELLRGQLAMLSTFGGNAAPLLLKAARRLERVDPNLSRDTYLDAWGAALLAGRLCSGGSLTEVSRAARSARRRNGASNPGDLLLDSLAAVVTDGRAGSQSLLEEATRTFADGQFPIEATLRWGWLTMAPAYMLWDEDSTHAILVRRLHAVRQAGWLAGLTLDLATLNILSVRCGDFVTAEEAIAEARDLTEAIGSDFTHASTMTLAAYRGRELEARAEIEAAKKAAITLGQGTTVEHAGWVLAVLCNGLGQYRDVVDAAREESPDEPIIVAWSAPELLEAATRTGDAELARGALKRVIATAGFSNTESARGMLARCRALVSEGDTAERLYKEAIERLARTRLRPELARAHLLYGEWLRRSDRHADARAELRAAHDRFTSIGMEAFAERARKELETTGETVRNRAGETRDDLTAQERQIARLARDGLSNSEIGARLFLSPRTVEWHLRKVFVKLDIRSRRQLAGALPSTDSELIPA